MYQERGIPYIQTYMPKEYDAGPDNWDVIQSEEGVMYFGNKDGILEYDGVSWRLIQLPNKGVVRSLAIDSNNRIFIGGYNTVGFLAPDSIGFMQFYSLQDKLDPLIEDFQNVWQTLIINDQIYFRTSTFLMRWNGKEFRVWESKLKFGVAKALGNELFILEGNKSIKKSRRFTAKRDPV